MSLVPFERTREWIELLPPAAELARSVANTDFVKRAMRGNPAAITAAILFGDEVGLGPMQALAKIDVIDGRPSLAAETQRALILSAGHELWIEESSTQRVTVAGRRRDSEQTTRVTWSLEDARRANLAGKPTWRAYPRQMLLARASAELARAVFADVIGGLPATEEILEDVDAVPVAEPVALEAVAGGASGKRTRQRKRATATVSAGTAEPPGGPEPEPPPLVVDEPQAPERPPEPEPPPVPGYETPAQAAAAKAEAAAKAAEADDGVEFESTAPPPPEPEPEPPAEPEPPPMLTEKDRRFLHARKNELGLSDETLKDLIERLTGQRSTTKIPAARLGDLLNAMAQHEFDSRQAPPAPATSPATPPATVQASLELGRPPHEDRG